jgi:UDPglucose--hexose-1-phosphate uridylyltransferase
MIEAGTRFPKHIPVLDLVMGDSHLLAAGRPPPVDSPHRRFNQLTGEWVLVSPQRVLRPWKGQVEPASVARLPEYDPSCQLCPANVRDSGIRNPHYSGTYVFDNDFPALSPEDLPHAEKDPSLLAWEEERGVCRVVCSSPDHSASLSTLSVDRIATVVETWSAQYAELAALPFISHVQIFENRGAMMGASNPHPHSQIWATSSVPDLPALELGRFRAYGSSTGSCLLCDYVALESRLGERIVYKNRGFLAVVPFWAVWPFEVLILPVGHVESLPDLDAERHRDLAETLSRITQAYDNLFAVPFPYSMGFHQGAAGARDVHNHLHLHFFPPLLRSATVRKHMVGYELLCGPQRDLTPEQAAERLRQ